jgi:hypothetical protein
MLCSLLTLGGLHECIRLGNTVRRIFGDGSLLYEGPANTLDHHCYDDYLDGIYYGDHSG